MITSEPQPRESSRGPLDGVLDIAASDPRFTGWLVLRPHPLLCILRRDPFSVVVVPSVVWDRRRDLLQVLAARLAEGQMLLLLLGTPRDLDAGNAVSRGIASLLPSEPSPDQLWIALQTASELLETRARSENRGRWLNRYRYELGELIEIAKAITTERELSRLLSLILEKSRFITGADAGSIYVVEGDDPDPLRRALRFKLSQNDSAVFDSREFTIPVSSRSMSGYVALHRSFLNISDVYSLPPGSPYGFDRSFDAKTGYRTKSMLCAPLLSRTGDAIGVIQLINKKKDPERRLTDVDAQIVSFDERSEELLATLASQAGISLENAILYDDIQRMLEGFVRASVEAIEQRDPTTSGHSRRVADLTVGLARAVERSGETAYVDVRWTPEDLKELEYASLLHDFGKIGVREQVLVKAKKLFPHELESIRHRFEYAILVLVKDTLERKLDLVHKGCQQCDLQALDRDLDLRRGELAEALAAIIAANEPTVLRGGDFARIEAVARETYQTLEGEIRPLLGGAEVACLSVSRGSLTTSEIDEIRGHVSLTYEFLSRIPWGKQFRRVALIAGAHHERLNGTGYPNRLRAEEIPLQSKMMSVADIFDALTASDRPYKRAVPLDKALDILGFEVKDQHIDGQLVRIFTEARVWESLAVPVGASSMR